MLGLCALFSLTWWVYASVVRHGWIYEDAAWRAQMRATWVPSLNLSLSSFNLQAWLGASVGAFHLFNLGVHLLNGWLVYRLARPLVGAWAVLATGIFLLHPIQREAVNYISGRPDVVSTGAILGLVLAARAAVRVRDGRWWVVVAACALVAFATKASAIVGVPLALLTLTVLDHRVRAVRAVTWLIVMGAVFGLTLLSPIALSELLRPTGLSVITYAGHQAVAIWRLVALVIVPVGFTIDHDYAWVTPWYGLLALAACGLGARYCWGRRLTAPALAWAGLWIAVALAPRLLALGVYNGEWSELNEHQFYVAMPGVSIGLAACLKGWV